jgi:hypothetical protein
MCCTHLLSLGLLLSSHGGGSHSSLQLSRILGLALLPLRLLLRGCTQQDSDSRGPVFEPQHDAQEQQRGKGTSLL